jgi:hypothetical protein
VGIRPTTGFVSDLYDKSAISISAGTKIVRDSGIESATDFYSFHILSCGTTGKQICEYSTYDPDDCDCWDADPEPPCWPCYRDGFEAPNPSATE